MLSRYATLKSRFSNPLRTPNGCKDEFFCLTSKGVAESVFTSESRDTGSLKCPEALVCKSVTNGSWRETYLRRMWRECEETCFLTMRRIFLLYFSRGRNGVRGDGGKQGRGAHQRRGEKWGGGIDQGGEQGSGIEQGSRGREQERGKRGVRRKKGSWKEGSDTREEERRTEW
jgi:hypothetical protein